LEVFVPTSLSFVMTASWDHDPTPRVMLLGMASASAAAGGAEGAGGGGVAGCDWNDTASWPVTQPPPPYTATPAVASFLVMRAALGSREGAAPSSPLLPHSPATGAGGAFAHKVADLRS